MNIESKIILLTLLTTASNGINITAMKQAVCSHCERKFTPKTEWQKYCGQKCSNRASQARLRARAKLATKQAMSVS